MKKFYTERDIEDMFHSGQMTLQVGDDVVLTDLAYERARRLGVKLVEPNEQPPAAPVRPYVSKIQTPSGQPQMPPSKSRPSASAPAAAASPAGNQDQIKERVRQAVYARLGNQVDPTLLNAIIDRILSNVKVK